MLSVPLEGNRGSQYCASEEAWRQVLLSHFIYVTGYHLGDSRQRPLSLITWFPSCKLRLIKGGFSPALLVGM